MERGENTVLIKLPERFRNIVDSKNALIEKAYSQINATIVRRNRQRLCERAVSAVDNVHVDEINFTIQETLPGEFVVPYTVTDENKIVNYLAEFLNSLDLLV